MAMVAVVLGCKRRKYCFLSLKSENDAFNVESEIMVAYV